MIEPPGTLVPQESPPNDVDLQHGLAFTASMMPRALQQPKAPESKRPTSGIIVGGGLQTLLYFIATSYWVGLLFCIKALVGIGRVKAAQFAVRIPWLTDYWRGYRSCLAIGQLKPRAAKARHVSKALAAPVEQRFAKLNNGVQPRFLGLASIS